MNLVSLSLIRTVRITMSDELAVESYVIQLSVVLSGAAVTLRSNTKQWKACEILSFWYNRARRLTKRIWNRIGLIKFIANLLWSIVILVAESLVSLTIVVGIPVSEFPLHTLNWYVYQNVWYRHCAVTSSDYILLSLHENRLFDNSSSWLLTRM